LSIEASNNSVQIDNLQASQIGVPLHKALESLKSIKLSGGIFGKTSLVLVVLCLCVTAVSLKMGIWWFSLVLMAPTIGLVFYLLKRVLDFAEKNPQAAIMDGAELLVHEKILHSAKSIDVIDTTASIDDKQPILADEHSANKQDEKPNPSNSDVEGK